VRSFRAGTRRTSVKWLHRVTVAERPFAGPFEAVDYRLAATADAAVGRRLTTLAVHSLSTTVADGARGPSGRHLVGGIAWGGVAGVDRVDVSVDRGPWRQAELVGSAGSYGRTHWRFDWAAIPGLRTLPVHATDGAGNVQPAESDWNEGGYAKRERAATLDPRRRLRRPTYQRGEWRLHSGSTGTSSRAGARAGGRSSVQRRRPCRTRSAAPASAGSAMHAAATRTPAHEAIAPSRMLPTGRAPRKAMLQRVMIRPR
jgi:hypothetical protein